MADAWNEKDVFLGALALPPAEREGYLRRVCPDDAARARIEALLRHHVESTELLSASLKSTELFTASGGPVGPEVPLPEQIDEFKVLGLIKAGGMGVVYLAQDTILNRRVALKVLGPHLVGSAEALGKLQDEARTTAALKHPGIVPVYKFGVDRPPHYLAIEYVDGPTLAAVIEEERERRRTLATGTQGTDWRRRCAEIVGEVADALSAVHRAGIVHRDVKPTNILMDREQGARLTDFGIAKDLKAEGRTFTSAGWGSCHYMSPEQAAAARAGAKVTEKSDIFSLGVVLYEMLSLRLPFEGDTNEQVLRAVVSDEPARLRSLDRRIPRKLETICHIALEKDPERRYPSAAHMEADLRCFLEGKPILGRPPSLAERGRRWAVAHRHSMVASGGALALGTAAVLGWAYRRAGQESMAWLSVESEVANCDVCVQGFASDTLDLTEEPRGLGKAPVVDALLPNGHYRVTVKAPGEFAGAPSRFAEFSVLLETGRRRRTRLRVHAPGPDGVSGAYSESDGALRVLDGTLMAEGAGGEGMITVKEGNYTTGRFDDDNPAIKKRTLWLPAFDIDAREVSNSEYRAFTAATGHPWPRPWQVFGYDQSLADLPVIGVTLEDAEAYARWCGKRLATMFEWEAAARGGAARLYPWEGGIENEPEGLEPCLDDKLIADSRFEGDHYDRYRLRAVTVMSADPAPCPGGMLHAFDNVRELTETVFVADRAVVIVGNSWRDSPRYRTLADVDTFPMDRHSFTLGFRCARSARPAEHAR